MSVYEYFEEDYYDIYEYLKVDHSLSRESLINIFNKRTLTNSGIERFLRKVVNDPYYFDLYINEKSIRILYNAGFFLDKYKVISNNDIKILTTPVGKIINNIKQLSNKNNLVVLLSTGGFSPLHIGHQKMMENAKIKLEEEGFTVIGGYFSPSHDEYVSSKYNGEASMNIEKRIYLAEKVVMESSWLMADKWEGYYRSHSVNFTDVIIRLKKYLNYHLNYLLEGNIIEIAYIYGTDNLEFSRVFKYNGIGVCVNRGNVENYLLEKIRNHVVDSNVFFTNGYNENISSSKVRKGNLNYIDDKIKNYYKNNEDTIKGIYEIRNDFNLSINKNCNCNIDIKKLLINNLKSYTNKNLTKKIIEVCDQVNKFNLDVKVNKKTISLDVYVEGDYNIGVSRIFDVSDSQMKSIRLINRPGTPLLTEQIKLINKGNYWLVDDDMSTGYTFNTIKNYLNKHIKIDGFIGLNDLLDNKRNHNDVYDIVDIRDFILGSKNGGLVIELPNGLTSRVLYALPYVSVINRASIELGKEIEFSLKIWEINKEIYKNSNIKIKELDESILNWIEYLGFNKEDHVIKFIDYHIDYIKEFVR